MCDQVIEGLAVRLITDHEEGVVHVLACVDHNHAAVESQLEDAGFEQDPDVLDTWFSSALWPMSTMGWPDPTAFPEVDGLLEAFNPTNVLCTAREIITLWVSRMVMFNRYFLDGRLPFHEVYIHPMVQDGHGQKMSKSLGNGVDPRDIIHSHGTDALRLVMAQIATATQDVRLPVDLVDPHSGQTFTPEFITSGGGHQVAAPVQASPAGPGEMITVYGLLTGEEPSEDRPLAKNTSSRFDVGRNFANKVWNAARFALGRVESPATVTDLADLSLADRWMLARLATATDTIEETLHRYRFSACAEAVYDVIWRDFCDWYLEAIKPTVATDHRQQQVLLTVVDAVMRLLHPICPFVTEAIWPHVQALGPRGVPGLVLPDAPLIAESSWPECNASLRDEQALARTDRLRSLVGEIRAARADNEIPAKSDVRLLVPLALEDLAMEAAPVLAAMCRVKEVSAASETRPPGALAVAFEGAEVLIDPAGAVDPAVERARLEAKQASLQKTISGLEGRLANAAYVEKAPPHLVEETRSQLKSAQADLAATHSALGAIG